MTEHISENNEEQVFDAAIRALEGQEEAQGDVEEPQVDEQAEPKVEAQAPKEKKDTLSEVYSRSLELEAQNRELKKQLSLKTNIKELAKDPMALLSEAGLSLEDVIQLWASQGVEEEKHTNTEELDSKPEKLDSKNEEIVELRNQLAQLQDHLNQKQVNEYKNQTFNEIDGIISKDDGDRWEYVQGLKSEGSYDLVIEVATELYKSTNNVPTYEEVLDAVENHLAETLENQSQKLTRFKKIQKKLAIESLGSKVKQKEATPEAVVKPELTSLFERGASASIPTDDADESARWQRAIKALESK